MDMDKQKRLETNNWLVGSAEEFLDLTDEEKGILNQIIKNCQTFSKFGIKNQYREVHPRLSEYIKGESNEPIKMD